MREAEEELSKGKLRQAYNKVFLAWRGALALIAAKLLEHPAYRGEVMNALKMLPEPAVSGEGVRITTGNAARVLPRLQRLCMELDCPEGITEALRVLAETRKDAYMLHTAFYEGAEHAGFEGDDEAAETAKRLIERLGRVLALVHRG